MDLDVERSDRDATGQGGATTRVWGVRHATEEVELSATEPYGGGFDEGSLPTRAVLVYDDPPDDASSPDGVYPESRIACGEAGDREVLSVTLAAAGKTQTVDRVLEFEVAYGADDSEDGDGGETDRANIGVGRDRTRTRVRLDDDSEWNLGGRPVTVTADVVERITGD
jgi:hypothetical protein